MTKLQEAIVVGAAGLGVGGIIAMWIVIIGLFIGWIINMFKIVGLIGQDLSLIGIELVIRVLGIPIGPLGGIMGWFY